jgi:hypothetical protein
LSFEFIPFTTLPYSKFQRKDEVRTKTKNHEQTDKEAVHIEALDVVREVIYSQVIILKTIVKLSQSRNDEEKAVSAVSFISSSLWYIEDFSITNERKITNVTQRKQTKQTI